MMAQSTSIAQAPFFQLVFPILCTLPTAADVVGVELPLTASVSGFATKIPPKGDELGEVLVLTRAAASRYDCNFVKSGWLTIPAMPASLQ